MKKWRTYAEAHTAAARAYQLRAKGEGRCIKCPKPAAIRTITDGQTGRILYRRSMVFCGEHWQQNRERES